MQYNAFQTHLASQHYEFSVCSFTSFSTAIKLTWTNVAFYNF